jgi:hypothetical protein
MPDAISSAICPLIGKECIRGGCNQYRTAHVARCSNIWYSPPGRFGRWLIALFPGFKDIFWNEDNFKAEITWDEPAKCRHFDMENP